MTDEALRALIHDMTQVVLTAGELAAASQGKVTNIGKSVTVDEDTPKRISQRGEAKTEIDEKVQEMILRAIKDILGVDGVKIDAEEDTPTKELFCNHTASLSVIIDPIDGTLEYLNGSDWYSINVGLVQNGKLLTTLVYFPVSRKLYYLNEHQKPYLTTYSKDLQLKDTTEITPPEDNNSNYVYTNNRVPTSSIAYLKENGFWIVGDDGNMTWVEGMLNCMSGKFAASIFVSPQIRDMLIGTLIEKMPGGYAMGFQGESIVWPDEGRIIPGVIFGFGKLPEAVKKCFTIDE